MSGQDGQESESVRPPIAANLDHEIRRLDLTTADIAQRLRIHERQVGRWRNGETTPSWGFVVQLAGIFRRDPSWFYAEHERDHAPEAAA